MYKSNIIEVLIASPSDVIEEKEIVRRVIDNWNITDGKEKGLMLRAVSWDTDTFSSFRGTGQDNIDKQIVKDADLLIAIFHTRIGTPVNGNSSGTVGEIKMHIEAEKPAMAFFSDKAIERENNNTTQLDKLAEFRKWCSEKSLYSPYKDNSEFEKS